MKHILNTNKRTRIIKVMAVALAFCLTMGIAQKTVMASGYTSFPNVFNYVSGMPSSDQHLLQTIEVKGNGNKYAYAKCTSYTSGSGAVLQVVSISSAYPTASTTFTYVATNPMMYISTVPATNQTVKFQGQITTYKTGFTIAASVQG